MFTLSPEGFCPRTTLARPSAGPPLTHLPATLTSHLQSPEKSATLSLAFAALTSHVKHKSCVCHSYKKHPGWGYTLQPEMSSFPNLTTRHSPLGHYLLTTHHPLLTFHFCYPNCSSKEPHAVAAPESDTQHRLLQAHPLVAIPAGHPPYLFLRRIPRRHV